jgi:hypothetical protein
MWRQQAVRRLWFSQAPPPTGLDSSFEQAIDFESRRLAGAILMKKFLVGIAVATALTTSFAQAATVYPVSATAPLGSYDGYPASDAIDQGGSARITDWAAASTGAGSYLNLDLGTIYSLTSAYVTDRVTSGAGNSDPVLGSYDFTRSFSLQAYTDGTFTTPIGAAVIVSGLLPPPTGAPVVVALGGLTAEFLRYTVLVTDGVNPGLADIHFDGSVATPLPAALPLFAGGLGVIGVVGWRRKRKICPAG